MNPSQMKDSNSKTSQVKHQPRESPANGLSLLQEKGIGNPTNINSLGDRIKRQSGNIDPLLRICMEDNSYDALDNLPKTLPTPQHDPTQQYGADLQEYSLQVKMAMHSPPPVAATGKSLAKNSRLDGWY